MEDILEVYGRPYPVEYPVLCMDESSKQLVGEVRKAVIGSDGIERYDSEYERNGSCNIFIMCEPLKGRRYTSVTTRRTKLDWAFEVKKMVDNYYSSAKKIILVLDNLNIHRGASLY